MKALMKFVAIMGFVTGFLVGLSHVCRLAFRKIETTPKPELGLIEVATLDEVRKLCVTLENVRQTYGFVTIADLYDLVGLPSTFVDDKYGWFDFTSLGYFPNGDVYALELPPVVPWSRYYDAKSTSK